jgi:hypothetical protein
MRLRCLAAGVVPATVASGLVAVNAAEAQPPAERRSAACAYRVCFVLTDLEHDSDGDGYADVDERLAGSDPGDPNSFPTATDLLRLFNLGQLPSFQEHFTEVVVLPVVTPDRSSFEAHYTDGSRDGVTSSRTASRPSPTRSSTTMRPGTRPAAHRAAGRPAQPADRDRSGRMLRTGAHRAGMTR